MMKTIRNLLVSSMLFFNMCCSQNSQVESFEQQRQRHVDELETKLKYDLKRDEHDDVCVKYILQKYVDKVDKNTIDKQIDDIDHDLSNIRVYETVDKNKNVVNYIVEYDKRFEEFGLQGASRMVNRHYVHMLDKNFDRKDIEKIVEDERRVMHDQTLR